MKHDNQLAKEARWALWLTLIYLAGWAGFAYFSPNGRGFLGFPIWFECACIYLPLLFIGIIYVVITRVYQHIDLDGNE